jgi:hypothetical protein
MPPLDAAAEFLKPAVSPDGSARMGPDDSSRRAGGAQKTRGLVNSPRPSWR